VMSWEGAEEASADGDQALLAQHLAGGAVAGLAVAATAVRTPFFGQFEPAASPASDTPGTAAVSTSKVRSYASAAAGVGPAGVSSRGGGASDGMGMQMDWLHAEEKLAMPSVASELAVAGEAAEAAAIAAAAMSAGAADGGKSSKPKPKKKKGKANKKK